MQPIASVSVDLDSLPHYCRIQGLSETLLDDASRNLVYTRALPRLLELFSSCAIPFTLFAIGEDLSDPVCAGALREAVKAGAEVASHSHTHDYALSRRSPEVIERELLQAEEAISAVTGKRPVGFRAPGYTLSPELYQALVRRGYAYDSSTFPSAPYYAAKATVRALLRVLGRPSRSILDTPRVLTAPRAPYRPAPEAPYRQGSGEVLELPVATTPGLSLPFIGTFVTSMPWSLVRASYLSLRGAPHLNLELHGVDLLDEADGVPKALVRQQRDLAVPLSRKRARLTELFGWLKDDFRLSTLEGAAQAFGVNSGA